MANRIKRYVHKIERRLRVDKATRLRILADLSGDIQARLEAGESPEAIMAELGSAEEVADGFNAEFADCAAPRKSRWRWLLLVLAGIPLAEAAVLGFFLLSTGAEGGSVGVIGGADGPTAIFVTTTDAAWGVGEKLSLALSCLSAFLLLQWPAAEQALSRVKRYLPLLLAASALLLWLLAVLEGFSGWGALAGSYLLKGGLLATVLLVFALYRLRRK